MSRYAHVVGQLERKGVVDGYVIRINRAAKKIETKAWRTVDPIGHWTNKQIGRLGLEAFYPTQLDGEIDKAARIVTNFTSKGEAAVPSDQDGEYKDGQVNDEYAARKTQKVLYNIPAPVLRGAKGVAIFTVFRSGLGISGAGGSGIVMSRYENGDWGAPSGILVHTVGWGLMVGVDVYDVVLVLRTQEAVNAFKYPKISIGGELSVAAGPVGNGAIVDSGLEASPCLSYVKSKGLYAGAQLDGSIFLTRSDENARYYNYPGIPIETILDNKLPKHQIPYTCKSVWQALYVAEGRPDYMGTDAIPEGPSPGNYEATDEEKAALAKEQDGTSTSSAPILPPPRRVSKAAEAEKDREPAARQPPPPPYDATHSK